MLPRMGLDTTGSIADLIARVRRHTELHGHVDAICETNVDGLTVMQARTPTPLTGTVYSPVVCLILQGSKEIATGPKRISCSAGQAVIVSHELPIASRITVASPQEPYLAMLLRLDTTTLRSLIDDFGDAEGEGPVPESLQVGCANGELIDAMRRLFGLSANRRDARVLAPLIVREIHYRLLTVDHGATLRRLLRPDSHASRISAVIARIRDDLAEPVSIAELARLAHMSPSTLHHHFKAVTGTTPLHYKKQLQLIEARRLLVDDGRSVAEAADIVGYQSPTQFSREFSRTFGIPPRDARTRPPGLQA
jgi:AraC-like DNA-binding protein